MEVNLFASNLVTVIVPIFNEEETIRSFYAELRDVAKEIEIIFVDDGSTDKSADIISELSSKDMLVHPIYLARNCGHMAAITAGLDHANGDWIVTIDGDGQDSPNLIPRMIEKALLENADICYAVRLDRKNDSLKHRLFSPLFYKILEFSTQGNSPAQAADYRLMSRRVTEVLKLLPERNRIYRVICSELKFKGTQIHYSRNIREKGISKYSFVKLLKLAFQSFLATTGKPLRMVSFFSLFVGSLSTLIAFFAFLIRISTNSPAGWTSIILYLSVILVMQSLSFGIISEILLNLSADMRARPLYQVRRSENG
jgi:dolichol-phosphate mannosyltransferase